MIYLGIDGGGSKTTFLLTDDQNEELCRVQSGPSNWLSIGKEAAADSLRDGAARLRGPIPAVVCGGFAGAGRREGLDFFRNTLQALFPHSRIRVESDAFVAYAGALGLKPGVLLIAGTGSIAIGRKPDGSMIRVGGWGPHFGDEGSGFWIGREAVRAALHAYDSAQSDEFPSRISSALGLASVKDVAAGWADGAIRVPDIAALFPEVVKIWPNEPAARILKAAAAELLSLTERAMDRVGRSHPVAASGSIASHPIMRQLIGLQFATPLATPEQGAILLAETI